MVNKRDPQHSLKWSNIQIHRADKESFERLRDGMVEHLGFRISITQMFSIILTHVTCRDLLQKMLEADDKSNKP